MDERARALAFSPEFQRLRYIRLCNINSLYLTGASEPKRFEHCLGVYHLAVLWTRSRTLTTHQAEIVKSAALLHDLQTGPFGHSFQYVMEDNPFEQRFEHANLSSAVRNQFLQLTQAGAHFSGRPFIVHDFLGDAADDVFAAIAGTGPFGPLISGTLDLDNLDNVVRLAFHMGLCIDSDRTLPARLAPMLQPVGDRLGAPTEALPLVQRWFELRRELYDYLLLDRGEFAAKAMLTFAVELAAVARLLGPDDWRLTDDALLEALQTRSVGEHQVIGQVVKRLSVGDLFECVAVWRTGFVELYRLLSEAAMKRKLERAIDEELARGPGSKIRINLHFILDHKKTCRSLSFIDLNTEEEQTIGYDSCNLLVGAFVTNARARVLTAPERRRTSRVVIDVLRQAGLNDLLPAPEPLAEKETSDGLFAE